MSEQPPYHVIVYRMKVGAEMLWINARGEKPIYVKIKAYEQAKRVPDARRDPLKEAT